MIRPTRPTLAEVPLANSSIVTKPTQESVVFPHTQRAVLRCISPAYFLFRPAEAGLTAPALCHHASKHRFLGKCEI